MYFITWAHEGENCFFKKEAEALIVKSIITKA